MKLGFGAYSDLGIFPFTFFYSLAFYSGGGGRGAGPRKGGAITGNVYR